MGSQGVRTTRKISKKLGRPSKVTKSICQMLVDPARNPIRDQLYKAQIEYHGIPCKLRQLQLKLKGHTKGGRWYKMTFVKKTISKANCAERKVFGYMHIYKPIEEFFLAILYIQTKRM